MKQVFIIGGGGTFATRERFLDYLRHADVSLEVEEHPDWRKALRAELGPDYQVAIPQMPNKQNVQYDEWALWFERHFPLLQDDVVLVGWSLGAIFLAKYLSENKIALKPSATFLLAAPYDATDENNLIQFKFGSLDQFAAQARKIYLYHSKDDHIVDFAELAKYRAALPNATVREFESRGHFYGQASFPELVADIKAL